MRKSFLHIISLVTIFVLACSWLHAEVTLPSCDNEKTQCEESCAEKMPCCEGEWVQFHSDIGDAYRTSTIKSIPIFFSILKVSIVPIGSLFSIKAQELPSPIIKAQRIPIYKQHQNFRL